MRDGSYVYLAMEIGASEFPPDQHVIVYRPAEEVNKAFADFNSKGKIPVTVDHPSKFLNLKDSAAYRDGMAESPYLEKKAAYTTLSCNLELFGKTKEAYDSGTKELSCGAEWYFQKSDNPAYDYVMLFKELNHVAMVDRGRCGSICRINDGGKSMTFKELKDALDLRYMSDDMFKKILTDHGVTEESWKEKYDALIKEVEDAKKRAKDEDEEEEKKKKEAEEKKAKDEDEEEKKKAEDEDEEEEKKKEAKDGVVFDRAAVDKMINDAVERTKDEVSRLFGGVMPVITSGALPLNDIAGKRPCLIKDMFIEKVLGEKVSEASREDVFKLALKAFQNPKWKGVEDEKANKPGIAEEISKIDFKNGGNR